MNYFPVTIPVPVLAPGFNLPATTGRHYSHVRPRRDDLHIDFLDWLESKGCTPRDYLNVLLFAAPQGGRTEVHTDHGPAHLWALNYAIDCEVKMCWHSVADKGNKGRDPDLKYVVHPLDTSPVVEETTLGSAVCRISVPHSSYNVGPSGWLLSVRMMTKKPLVSMPFLQLMFNR